MSLTADQKNANILSRFESKSSGTKSRKFTVFMQDGSSFPLICMNGESTDEASASCLAIFGERFSHVEA